LPVIKPALPTKLHIAFAEAGTVAGLVREFQWILGKSAARHPLLSDFAKRDIRSRLFGCSCRFTQSVIN
jgi:hypothetical protein